MNIRNLDQCTCGHIRKDHEDFKDECAECDCGVFHRNILLNL